MTLLVNAAATGGRAVTVTVTVTATARRASQIPIPWLGTSYRFSSAAPLAAPAAAVPCLLPLPFPPHFHFSPPPAHRRQKPFSIHSRRSASNMGHNGDDHITGDWFTVPDLRLRDHRFIVPLDYSSPNTSHITVFAREVVAVGKEEQSLPYLLYLQGGPGFESPRPTEASGWIKRACEEFRVILLDQRGTGLSSPFTVSSLSQMRPAQHMADYLKHFRADSIVNDAEFIRVRLVPDGGRWTILGQSFGGFCAVTYLSFAPQGLQSALITGGLPPLGKGCTADVVYTACFQQIQHQNDKFYKRFPQDVEIVRDVVNYLVESEGGGVLLPSGGLLTPRGLQTLGLAALGSGVGFERLHFMFERVWEHTLVPGAPRCISYFFLKNFENWMAFDTNPLYALLHEPIYCQGASSQWSANKVRDEFDHIFDPIKAARENRPVLFTGEMVFPWMFDEIKALRPFKEVAHLLAMEQDWPPLYDIASLNNNQVPVAAAVYYEDMYVNFKLAMETSAEISGIRLWITNEYMHSGLRDGGSQVLDHLLAMLKGRKPLF